jgi:hypothetical protein
MGPGYPDRFMELFARRGEPVTVVDGAIFKLYSGMVVPFGPVDADYSLPPGEAARALRSLGGMLLRTTSGFRPAGEASEWYAVICRAFTPIEDIPSSNTRSKLRRGLRNCEARRISSEELARSGYEVYRKAFDRYGASDVPDPRPDWEAWVMSSEGFDDIVHHWGVLCDGRLAGFSSNYVFGDTEVAYSTLKFHPDHLGKYASYALFHRMNEYYLGERRVAYVNDGFRSILHGSELQGFLEHNFSFERAYTGIEAIYRLPYRMFLGATFPFRNLIGKIDDRVRALYELERVVRAARIPS